LRSVPLLSDAEFGLLQSIILQLRSVTVAPGDRLATAGASLLASLVRSCKAVVAWCRIDSDACLLVLDPARNG
jgi:hypothetical protein